ncbi:hypothetical protein BDY24DRAFT_378236 [Mrakia frigida]|uniref:uncharacterized protein n=1 Tax=Mrakia frigida TaxID=29902 RepID=UPI003FCC2030
MIRSFGDLSLDSPSPPSISRVPPEIWLKIFNLSTNTPVPYEKFYPAIKKIESRLGKQNKKLQAAGDKKRLAEIQSLDGPFAVPANMKAFALVSKEWNSYATPILYRFITLRSFKQTIAFIKTLQSDLTLGHHVRELELDVSEKVEARLWKPSSNPSNLTLGTLFELLPNFRAISGGPVYGADFQAPQLLAAFYILQVRTPLLALHDVEISENNYLLFTQAMTRLSSSLQTIRLAVTHFDAPSSLPIEAIERTSFPNLHTLIVELVGCHRMSFLRQEGDRSPFFFDLLSHWTFPSLRAVEFWLCCSGREVDPSDFFVRNGRRIEELTWNHRTWRPAFLDHAHLLPELKMLGCGPFEVVTPDADELRNLGRVETLVVSEDILGASFGKGFFERVDKTTMAGLKTVVLKPTDSIKELKRRMPKWRKKLEADGVRYLELEGGER